MTKQAWEMAFVWCFRSLQAIVCYLVIEMRVDIKAATHDIPVMQEQIRTIQDGQNRLNNKVFSFVYLHTPVGKKEDEITIDNLLKKQQ